LKIAVLNDTHTGIRNSSDIFINYQEKFYRDVFFPYLLENNIKKIIHLGDYYEHRKFINFKALHSNRKVFLEKLREYGIHMDIIPGNHDVYYKNTNQLNSLKELLGHYMNEVNIIMKPTVVEYDNTNIGLIPWIAPDVEKESHEFLKNANATIIGGHFELAGFDMYRGMPCHDGMSSESLERFDLVMSGHFHTKSQQGNIHYLGSQMEFFWNDAGDKKYFHVLDTETKELTAVQNTHTLFEKFVYNDKIDADYLSMDMSGFKDKFVKVFVANKGDLYKFDLFIEKLQNAGPHELKIAENINEFIGANVADSDVNIEDTETLLHSYIDAVETDLDKDRIKAQVQGLMLEAQTLDIA
jgi:DNA repair exonuclease SbcCD nuclease subunit